MAGRIGLRLTREGFGFLLIGLVILGASFIQQVNLMVLISLLMAAIGLVGLWLAGRNLRELKVRRRLPNEAFVGLSCEIELEVFNQRSRGSALAITALERAKGGQNDFEAILRFLEIGPKSSHRGSFRIVPTHRGRLGFLPTRIRTRFPLGFFERYIDSVAGPDLIVYPRVGRLSVERLWSPGRDHTSGLSRQARPAESQEEFHGLHEYRPSDNPRHIHWKTTARRGQMMVKEFEPAKSIGMLLIIEPWLPAKPRTADQECLELLISFAATLCVELRRFPDSRFSLAIGSDPPVICSGFVSGKLLQECLEQLALTVGSNSAHWNRCLQGIGKSDHTGIPIWLASTRKIDESESSLAGKLNLHRFGSPIRIFDVSAGELEGITEYEL